MVEQETSDHEPSPIQELQSAFSSILLAQKHNPADQDIPTTSSISNSPPCTTPFPLFALPRELRDQIYLRTVFRPSGYLWLRRHSHTTIYVPSTTVKQRSPTNPASYTLPSSFPIHGAGYWADGDADLLSLFLTSKQVYTEALAVFCACNPLIVQKRQFGTLAGAVRLFPDRAGRLLQRLVTHYRDFEAWNGFGERARPEPPETWEMIVRDAWMVKEHFPCLRQFVVNWHSEARWYAENEGMWFVSAREEEMVEFWRRWLRKQYQRMGVPPPRWLRVEFFESRTGHQESWDSALDMLKEEIRVEGLEEKDGLEDSGRKWLEETGDDKRKRRGKEVIKR